MKTKAMFTIVVILAAIGMLAMAAVVIPSVPQAHAGRGIPGGRDNGNPLTPKCNPPNNPANNGEPCNGG